MPVRLTVTVSVNDSGVAVTPHGSCSMAANLTPPASALLPHQGWVGSDVLRARVQQFSDPSAGGHGSPVVLSRNPLFIDKARQFPGAYFLIGADTVKVPATAPTRIPRLSYSDACICRFGPICCGCCTDGWMSRGCWTSSTTTTASSAWCRPCPRSSTSDAGSSSGVGPRPAGSSHWR